MNISDRLGELAKYYHNEARKCAHGRAYLGATVFEMAALEAMLQAMCFIYQTHVKGTTVYWQKRFRRKRYKALEFKLYELINIASELSWFPSKRIKWGGKTANLAGFSHEVRKIRNLIHSGKWAMQRAESLKFSKGVYGVVLEVCDVANSWLLHRVERSLLKAMNS
jgi:hypothetical protein